MDVYCGYGQMDPVGSILLLLRPCMGYVILLYKLYVGYSSPNKGDSARFF